MERLLMLRVSKFLSRLENFLPQLFGHGGQPPAAFALAGTPCSYGYNSQSLQDRSAQSDKKAFSLEALIGDGFLWAVPKHRRSVEKRLNRKFGYPEYVWKPLKVKTTLRTCNQCGHAHEVGILCPHCYDRVRQETKLMQDKIQEKLGLDPVDKDVVVLYQGEKFDHSTAEHNGKRIIEMEKPRPMWFSKNLIQKTTQQPAESKEVKPSDLG